MQRRATKLIPERKLERLDLSTLSYLQQRENIIEVYKIISGKYDAAVSASLIDSTVQNCVTHLDISIKFIKVEQC